MICFYTDSWFDGLSESPPRNFGRVYLIHTLYRVGVLYTRLTLILL